MRSASAGQLQPVQIGGFNIAGTQHINLVGARCCVHSHFVGTCQTRDIDIEDVVASAASQNVLTAVAVERDATGETGSINSIDLGTALEDGLLDVAECIVAFTNNLERGVGQRHRIAGRARRTLFDQCIDIADTAAVYRVGTGTAGQEIVTRCAGQHVVARAAVQRDIASCNDRAGIGKACCCATKQTKIGSYCRRFEITDIQLRRASRR